MLDDSGTLGKMLLNNPDLCSDLHSLVFWDAFDEWIFKGLSNNGSYLCEPKSSEQPPLDKQSKQLKGCLC